VPHGKKFTVVVEENSHYQDDSHRYEHGEFDTLEAAIQAARKIVDEYLDTAYKPGMSSKQLFESYAMFGEDPFIRGAEELVPFSAWDYARKRCEEICSQNPRRGRS